MAHQLVTNVLDFSIKRSKDTRLICIRMYFSCVYLLLIISFLFWQTEIFLETRLSLQTPPPPASSSGNKSCNQENWTIKRFEIINMNTHTTTYTYMGTYKTYLVNINQHLLLADQCCLYPREKVINVNAKQKTKGKYKRCRQATYRSKKTTEQK